MKNLNLEVKAFLKSEAGDPEEFEWMLGNEPEYQLFKVLFHGQNASDGSVWKVAKVINGKHEDLELMYAVDAIGIKRI